MKKLLKKKTSAKHQGTHQNHLQTSKVSLDYPFKSEFECVYFIDEFINITFKLILQKKEV